MIMYGDKNLCEAWMLCQIRTLGNDILDGDVILSNHPQAGGSHLPDLTVITPVSSHQQPFQILLSLVDLIIYHPLQISVVMSSISISYHDEKVRNNQQKYGSLSRRAELLYHRLSL